MKKILSLVLVLALVLSSFSFAAADPVTVGEELKALGVLTGDENGNLNPDQQLTREQALVVLARMMGKEADAKATTTASSFKDIKGTFYGPYIAYAELQGWTNGLSAGVFGFGKPATIDEIYAFMLRALGYTVATLPEALTKAAELKLNTDVTAEAGKPVLRGQVFITMNNTLNTAPKDGKDALVYVLKLKDKPVVPVTKLEVASVKALNLKQVEIVFSKEVTEAEAVKLTNYVVNADGASANIADGTGAKAVLAADKKTVILTLEDGVAFVNSTKANKVVVKKEIGLEAEYSKADVAALDLAVPAIEKVATTGPKQITITFTEPLDRNISPAQTVSSFTLNNGTVTLDPTKATYVDADRTLTIETYITIPEAEHTLVVKAPASNNLVDYAGYKLPSTSIAFTHKKDTTVPVATLVSNTETTATIKFNKPVTNVANANVLYRHTYNSAIYQVGGADAGAVTNPSGDLMTYVINFGVAKPFPPGASTLFVAYNSATGTKIADNWGNEFAAASFALNTVVDAVKPEVASVTFKTATTLEVKFSETVDVTTAQTATNYVLKTAAGTAVTVSSAVLGGDNMTVTVTTATMNGGDYNLTVKNVKDSSLAGNVMVEVTKAFAASDTIAPTVVDKNTGLADIQVKQVATTKVMVEFSEAMDKASIENKANWRYNGAALLAADTVVAAADNKSVVITIAAGVNDAFNLTLGVVKDASGLPIAVFSTTLDIEAVTNIGAASMEIIAKNQIVIKFDQLIVGSTTADFEINNGGWAAPTAISVALVDGKTQITLTPLTDVAGTTGAGVQVRTVSAPATAGAAANSKNSFGTPVQIGAAGVTDKFAPALVATTPIQAIDINNDGFVDHFSVTFTESVRAGSVSLDKFTVDGYTVVDAFAYTGVGTPVFDGRNTAATGDSATVLLRVTQKTTTDLTAKPNVSIAAGILDVPGNALAPVTNKAANDAGPVATVTTATLAAGTNVTTAQSTKVGTVYLVLDSANFTTVAAMEAAVTAGTARKATVATANTNTTIVNTVSAVNLAEGVYKVIAVDASGNVSAESAGTITLDHTAPTAAVTTATIAGGANVTTAQSTELGTVYLVLDSANFTTVAAMEAAVTANTARKATVVTANTNTTIITTVAAVSLPSGAYKVIAVDLAGNVSAESTNTITIDATAPVLTLVSHADTAATTADLLFTSSEAGTYYYVVYAAADAAPNAATIIAQGVAVAKGTAAASVGANTVGITGLTTGTAYRVHVVVVDAVNNISAVSSTPSVTQP